MRDPELMADTLRLIRQNGGVATMLRSSSSELRRWHAGDVRLNGQAVTDLLNDGWIESTSDLTFIVRG